MMATVSDLRSVALFLLLLVVVTVIARLLRAASHPGSGPPRFSAALGLVALGGMWMLANQSVEGAVLLTLAEDRGVTVADLPAVALFLAAAAVAAWPRPRAGGTLARSQHGRREDA